MKIATRALQHRQDTKLLVIDSKRKIIEHAAFQELDRYLRPGDVLVINNAATLPASFTGTHEQSGQPIEMRLAVCLSARSPLVWRAVLFGEGSWRIPTENRACPPHVDVGDHLEFSHGLRARVEGIECDRLVRIKWLCETRDLWWKLYRAGRLVQYSYLERDLDLWDAQTVFADPPVSVEPPSAAFAFDWAMVERLRTLGIQLVALTHAAGLSSTGDPMLDRKLPLPELYSIPQMTADAINQARRNGHRVVALGTTVTRALESAVDQTTGLVGAGKGITSLKLTSESVPRVVSSLLTGMHEPGVSHLDLMGVFAERTLIDRAYKQAVHREYLWHEYGDLTLIF